MSKESDFEKFERITAAYVAEEIEPEEVWAYFKSLFMSDGEAMSSMIALGGQRQRIQDQHKGEDDDHSFMAIDAGD